MYVETIEYGEHRLSWLPLLKALYCWVISADDLGWFKFVAPWRVSWGIHWIIFRDILTFKRGLLW